MKHRAWFCCTLALIATTAQAVPRPMPVYTPAAYSAPVARPATIDVASEVLRLINIARQQSNCRPLQVNSALVRAATHHSTDMAVHHMLSHLGSDNKRLPTRADDAGYNYRIIAENVAAGHMTAAEVVQAWLDSPAHRSNILDCNYLETGIAIVKSDDAYELYWTQLFGTQLQAPRFMPY